MPVSSDVDVPCGTRVVLTIPGPNHWWEPYGDVPGTVLAPYVHRSTGDAGFLVLLDSGTRWFGTRATLTLIPTTRRPGTSDERTTVAEAVAALDAIDVGDDPEAAHSRADNILLTQVPAEVAAAYKRAADRDDGFWYS